MLQITRDPVGEGKHRLCYVHPEDPRKAVWIAKPGNNRQLLRELDFFRRLKRQGVSTGRHFPKCYGGCSTNLGPGVVVDLVRNHDGEISRSLHWYLGVGMPIEAFDACFEELIESLQRRLVVMKPGFRIGNLLVQKKSATSAHLVVTHGLGDSIDRKRFNPLPRLRRRRLRRCWSGLVAGLYQARDARI